MPLHLIKLSVGTESVQDLEEWIKVKRNPRNRAERFHITRMVPKRLDDLLAGGSIYWVIKGEVMCRETIVDVRPFQDKEGIGRCRLVLDGKLVLVEPRPYRPFQGWRYLDHTDAPRDLSRVAPGAAAMPDKLRRELAELGLL